VKHKIALSRNGVEYQPSDIRNRNKLVEMRYYGLTTSDGIFELVAVNPSDSELEPYFRYKVSPGNDWSRIENTPSHEFVKNALLDKIKEARHLRIYTVDKFDGDQVASELALCYLRDVSSKYSWFIESYQKIDLNGFSRWDIFGRNDLIGSPTSTFPNIIIEIVQSSFPSFETFTHMCAESINSEVIYVFYFISEDAHERKSKSLNFYWNIIEMKDACLNIRCAYYIKHGFFYRNANKVVYNPVKKNVAEEEFREFETEANRMEYWKKSWLYIRDSHFKKAVAKMNQ
jgi:hypothetical protein